LAADGIKEWRTLIYFIGVIMIIPYKGKHPQIGEGVYIAPTAVIIGQVAIEAGASVWFNAVLRGDIEPITIGADSNIQDNCTLHTDPGCPLTIGAGVTVGHNAVVHGCTIEDRVLIGMNAVLLNHSVVRSGSLVAAGAVITEGQRVGPNQLVAGMPAQVKKELGASMLKDIDAQAAHYTELAKNYAQSES